MLLLATALAAPPDLRPPCGSAYTLANLGPRHTFPAPPPAGGPLQEHDAYADSYPHELIGTHFHVKWGTSGGVSQALAQAVLDDFEFAWEAEVDGLQMQQPIATDQYYFNVYIGDTGGGTPSAYGNSGYYNRDDDGLPMIVIGADILGDLTWTEGTVVHEFFHSLQDATGRYDYTGDSAWYWEATAMWIEGEVLDGNYQYYAAFLYGYALLPELPVFFFDYPDTGALQEYHQYGAMIFPRYISEIAADPQMVIDSWTLAGDTTTPQDTLALELSERGIDMADAFGDFAARNTVWDYEDGDLYYEWVDYYAAYAGSDDHQIVDDVSYKGVSLTEAPEDTLPGRLAYNVVRLEDPDRDLDYVFHVEGAAKGSRNSPADWRFTVVVEDSPVEYLPISLTDGVGEITVPRSNDTLYLVAASVGDSAHGDETFSWSYAVTQQVPAGDTGDTGGAVADDSTDPAGEDPVELPGCACDHTRGLVGWGGVLLAGLAIRRRPPRLR